MGLFDMLENAVGGGGATGAAGSAAGAAPSNVVGAIVGMLQSQPGGIGGLVQQFERAGLGGVAQSWISPGANQSVTPGQVGDAIGQGPIADVAGRLGVGQDEAAGHLSQYLPQILDHLTPHGQTPTDGGLGGLGGILSQLGRS